MLIAVVNKHADLFRAYFLRTKAKDEQERVDYIRLAATVRSNNSIKTLFIQID